MLPLASPRPLRARGGVGASAAKQAANGIGVAVIQRLTFCLTAANLLQADADPVGVVRRGHKRLRV